jgi:hypothetical protein
VVTSWDTRGGRGQCLAFEIKEKLEKYDTEFLILL